MSRKLSLRFFSVDAGSLVATGEAPTALVQLAADLYGYCGAESAAPPAKSKKKAMESVGISRGTVLIFPSVPGIAINQRFVPSFQELRTWTLDRVVSRTSTQIEQWILESPGSDYPSLLAAAYGLIQLDLAMARSDPAQILEAACVAGRCLGVAARADGMVQGVSRGGKKAAAKRWKPRDVLEAHVRERYKNGSWRKKSQFIRDIEGEVLAYCKEHRLATTTTSVGPLIRRWIRDL